MDVQGLDVDSFTNAVVPPNQLPAMPSEAFEPLDPRYLRLRWIVDAIVAAVFVVVAAVVTVIGPEPMPRWAPAAVGAVLLFLIGLTAFLQRVEVRHLGYLIREHDLSFRQGVIGRSVATVPFARVQNVTIERGPLERWQGLASLEIRTAGGGLFGGITIAGLDHATAQRLRLLVVDRAGALADEERAGVQADEERAGVQADEERAGVQANEDGAVSS